MDLTEKFDIYFVYTEKDGSYSSTYVSLFLRV